MGNGGKRQSNGKAVGMQPGQVAVWYLSTDIDPPGLGHLRGLRRMGQHSQDIDDSWDL